MIPPGQDPCQSAGRTGAEPPGGVAEFPRFAYLLNVPQTNLAVQPETEEPDEALRPNSPPWKSIVARFQRPSNARSVWQLVNSLVPYAVLWYLMDLSRGISWWLTVPLAVLTAGFSVRLFIISHDCGHGSFFRSRRANDIVGTITGFIALTPYYHWRWEHSLHHATSGDLDRRGTGDIWTMTVQEYLEASRWRRYAYRLARNPIMLFVIGPLFVFTVWMRFPSPKAQARERRSVVWTNVALFVWAVAMSAVFGVADFLILELLVLAVAGAAGVWLFYVQHQFEGVYWRRRADWDYTEAALKGSSFYKLPAVLQWFTGNIGFHHIHHLSPRIPNYNLEPCHRADPLFHQVKPVTLLGSMKSFTFRLWDERRGRLVGYRAARRDRRAA
jgi:acyl-lipid omega-6 desaturase (Delta-12 desaturase)